MAPDGGGLALATEVLVDSLLLSRTDFLLKCTSAVSEFALYWTPSLINRSFDFCLHEHPLPSWAVGAVAPPN